MKVIYVAGPYSNTSAWRREKNIHRAEAAGIELVAIGASPLIPHANTGHVFWGTATPEFWYEATMELLRRSDAVLMLDGWTESAGAVAEKAEAERLGKPVFFFHNGGGYTDIRAWLEVGDAACDDGRAAFGYRGGP